MNVLMAIAMLAVASLAALGILARWHLALRRARLALEARLAASERELAAARRQMVQAEADQQFLARVVRELPHVAHEMHAGAGSRAIPKLLLSAVVRLLEPGKAIVAVRRRAAERDPDRHLRLAVAATSPEGCVPVGTEIPIGTGEIGYAAEVQRAMDRRDFESQPPATRRRLREEAGPGFQPDLVAPLIFNEEAVGVIAVEGPLRGGAEAKDALRLIAQVGAVSVHAQARYTDMKATASCDGLTGIFNKTYLSHRLAEELRRAQEEASSVSVLIFDVDNFKHYNDRNGHVPGDRLLQRLARLVLDNLRKDAVFGRYGGEEFLVIFPGTRRAQALAAAENVRRTIAAHEFPFRLHQPLGVISVSGGVAEYPLDGADAAALVRAADEALYLAKRSGRNRVVAYRPTYLGGEEAQPPLPNEEGERAGTLAVGTRAAADFTPAPGTLLALASVTPAAGVPKLTLEPSDEVLAAAVAAVRGPGSASAGPARGAGHDEG
ncbi:MAG TPA: GGDEF domain-containing protein [Vicinamibacteria bacterium]|nr:GGDEF domain-containing protein [Vicinamibacteria bacterium]